MQLGIVAPGHGHAQRDLHSQTSQFTTALAEFLPPVLRADLRLHPDVNIDLRERLSQDTVRAIIDIDGQTDIGIVAGTVRTENLETIACRRDELVLVVPRGHPLAGVRSR